MFYFDLQIILLTNILSLGSLVGLNKHFHYLHTPSSSHRQEKMKLPQQSIWAGSLLEILNPFLESRARGLQYDYIDLHHVRIKLCQEQTTAVQGDEKPTQCFRSKRWRKTQASFSIKKDEFYLNVYLVFLTIQLHLSCLQNKPDALCEKQK